MVDPYVHVGAALVDAKEHLVRVDRIRQTVESRISLLQRSSQRSSGPRNPLHIFAGKRRRTLIERHGDRGAEIGLDLRCLSSGPVKIFAPSIHVGVEVDALLFDLSEGAREIP